jgi:cellulose synthase/poly-beta-1,6-N-acetylglucosamine synthase-like glycosyltransferase
VGALEWPFEGLPLGWELLFTVALVVIVSMFAWTAGLFVRALVWKRREPVPVLGGYGFIWVFLVPALNEEVTIRDSVERLLEVPVAQKRILVIDDGSDDRTPEILGSIRHPDLFVLRRDPPTAQQGKAAALNNAYRALELLRGDVDRGRVIVCIVDADGRLDPEAPRWVAAHFADPGVGGVQSLVRIYNRGRLLTWLQDVEFGVYGYLFQAGRNDWGTAGMGGNGQFNRLSALDDVSEDGGPWRDRLTEDQDLGLRLIEEGWEGRQELRASVSQQGVSNPRALFRQRTRWSQGNLQAIGLTGSMLRAPIGLIPRVELLAYLLMPFWQGIVGVGLVAAIYLALTGVAPLWGGGPTWQLAFFWMLGFGGTILGCIAARTSEGLRGWVTGFLLGHVYSIYTWMIWPVLIRSTLRLLGARGSWAKTEREPLDAAAGPST